MIERYRSMLFKGYGLLLKIKNIIRFCDILIEKLPSGLFLETFFRF